MYALLNLPQAVVQQTYYVTLALLNEPSPLITHYHLLAAMKMCAAFYVKMDKRLRLREFCNGPPDIFLTKAYQLKVGIITTKGATTNKYFY